MNLIIIKEDKRAIPFSFKKEIREKYIVYKIFDEHKLTAKRIYKKLNKDRIMSVAFDNNISHSFKKYFEGKVNIIKKEDVLFFNMDKVVIKLANSLGIKDGKLSLGILADNNLSAVIRKMEKLKNKLKTLTVYSDNTEELGCLLDSFYKETGVPVIVREDYKNIDCDILIYLKNKKVNLYKFKGHLIDIFEATDKRGVKDIKVKFKEEKNIYNISDAVFSKIISEPFKINAFITKNTWHKSVKII